ncbi:Tn3 family transposase [Streptosporangium sp. G12]
MAAPSVSSISTASAWGVSTVGATSSTSATCRRARHAPARKICHGEKGEFHHRYERGLENQLGVLGLVLNCVVPGTTVYLDAAVRQLKAQGCPVREEDMARLSPFVSRHLGVHGAYDFLLPDPAPGTIGDLRDPDGAEDDEAAAHFARAAAIADRWNAPHRSAPARAHL